MINVHFITLGCPKNEADTALMESCVAASDYNITLEVDDADVVVINTCAFIQSATEESIEMILETARDWLPEKEGRHILVAGCMPSRYGAELNAEFDEVSAFLSVVDERTICSTIEALTHVPANYCVGKETRFAQASYAYIKIADGCNKSCAYCTIPSIRGSYKSTPLSTIILEVQNLVEQGVLEFILIAQDTTQYGCDLEEDLTLVDVINEICAIDGVHRVRIMYLQPDGVTDELLTTIAKQSKVCHYIEMPLQHSSKSILRSMNRRGDGASFEALIARIREYMPDVVLRTTLIVGFPGETEEDFEDLVSFVEHVEFDYVGIFPYSSEEGTMGATLPDAIDENVKLERLQTLRDVADSIGWSKAAHRVGSTVEVLVEGHIEGELYGRYYGQAPDIDGIVRLSSEDDKDATIGSCVSTKIFDSILYDLDGMM